MKPRVHREHIPGYGWFWRYTMTVDGKVLTGLRPSWRRAIEAVGKQQKLLADGWRP